jgi:hypothetical protein
MANNERSFSSTSKVHSNQASFIENDICLSKIYDSPCKSHKSSSISVIVVSDILQQEENKYYDILDQNIRYYSNCQTKPMNEILLSIIGTKEGSIYLQSLIPVLPNECLKLIYSIVSYNKL